MSGIRSGAALFCTGSDSRIREWNPACERLTGVPASEALGRNCWEVIAGHDDDGGIVCHPGCATTRLAQEGWPVRCNDLLMQTRAGPRKLTISTIVVRADTETVVIHPLREAAADEQTRPLDGARPRLTPRQRQILGLLTEGVRAKKIASRLSLSETTVRNHIRAILHELDAHSQLEAVVRARELSLELDAPAA